MSQRVYFLSWVRSGLTAAIPATTAASLDAAGKTAITAPITLTFTGDSGERADGRIDARLHGPGDVLGLAEAGIARVYPPSGTATAERSWFPYVEFTDAQLPWAFSTTRPQLDDPAPGARRGLQPWLTLVVVPADDATLTAATTTNLATLTVPVSELPDLSTAWLWAHTQIIADDAKTAAETPNTDPTSGLSRILCPRRLQTTTSYMACLVPTSDAGVRAGRGQSPPADDATLEPAWSAAAGGSVTLPVYYSWTFSTGTGGDIKSLVERLTPADVAGVGARPLDIGHAGQDMPGPNAGDPAWIIDFEGPLIGTAIHPGTWPDANVQAAIQDALAKRITASGDALRPPLYGGAQAGATTLPAGDGWLQTLNTDPRYRAAAAEGASLVRADQEPLIESAWEQIGQLTAANQLLHAAQLGRAAAASTYTATIAPAADGSAAIGDAELLQITAGVHTVVTAAPSAAARETAEADQESTSLTVAQALATNPSAAAAASPTLRRLTQPTSALASRAPAPLTLLPRVADPGAANGGLVVPPLQPVSGTTTLPELTPSGQNPVRLRDLTAQIVATPRLPWETTTTAAATPAVAGAPRDLLLPPGYLTDIWAYPTALGKTADWNGKPIWGWTAQAPAWHRGGSSFYAVPADPPAAIYRLPAVSPYPALAQVVITPSLQEWGPENSWQLKISVQCVLCGDLIPNSLGPGPIRDLPNPAGPPLWPLIDVVPPVVYSGVKYRPPYTDPPAPTAVDFSAAVATADLDGSNRPSAVVAYSITVGDQVTSGLTILPHLYQAADGSLATSAPSVAVNLPQVDGPVETMAITANCIYVVIGRRMFYRFISIGGFPYIDWTEIPGWDDGLQEDWSSVAIAAADFTGDGYGDLIMFTTQPIESAPGSNASHGELRIRYVSPANGSLGAWGDRIEVDAPADANSLLMAELTAGTAELRQEVTADFRAAAEQMQAVIVPRIPAAPPSPPPAVGLAGLASSVRTAIDPSTAVPDAVTGRISAPVNLAAQPDPLAPLLFTPSFPQPLSERLLASGVSQLVPGMTGFPDESIAVLETNPAVVEAILAGANTEFGRELRWRQFPARTDATYFTRFWSGTDGADPGPDISNMSTWDPRSALGSHPAPARDVEDMTVVVIRGQLLRQLSEVTIYSAPAVRAADGKRTVDLTGRTDPLFTGTLGADTRFLAFGFTTAAARGDADGLGHYLVFQEHAGGNRFGLDEPATDPPNFANPTAWRDMTWAQVCADKHSYDGLVYADGRYGPLCALKIADQNGGADGSHYWGFSAAHMAQITARPPALIVVHLSLYVPKESGAK